MRVQVGAAIYRQCLAVDVQGLIALLPLRCGQFSTLDRGTEGEDSRHSCCQCCYGTGCADSSAGSLEMGCIQDTQTGLLSEMVGNAEAML